MADLNDKKNDNLNDTLNDTLNQLTNTADTTDVYDPADIESNKIMALLSYIGILVLIPLFSSRQSPFTRFHVNQGAVLCVLEIIVWAVFGFLGAIPVIGLIFRIIRYVLQAICLVFAVLGIYNVVQGKAKELPFIGGIRLVK
ncbi:MAG: hypothetical protein IIY77_06280 [Lachnospiraceae bacterium]|nr:hypothetical protein [Lachnospiraceae bacterium]